MYLLSTSMASFNIVSDFITGEYEGKMYDLTKQPLRRAIKDSGARIIQFSGLKTPIRKETTKDFPDFTQSHGIVANMLNGIMVPQRTSKDFPNPTLAHTSLVKVINKEKLESAPNVVDMGCGAGFIGNYLAKNFDLKRLIFNDMSEDAIAHTIRTHTINSMVSAYRTKEDNIELRLGDAAEILSHIDGGLGFCAPYFIPHICEEFPGVYKLFAGVAKKQGLELFIAHSNLIKNYIQEAAETTNMTPQLIYTQENLPLFPEYADERDTTKTRLAQKEKGELFEETIAKLTPLGLKRSNNEKFYMHDICITRLK